MQPWAPGDQAIHGPHLATLRTNLDAAQFTAGWEQGRAMAIDEAVTYALAAED